jgi:hypothetical protein
VSASKKDFEPAATDSEAYRTGLALFQKALSELRVLRRLKKDEIWKSVKDGKKPADGKSFSQAYGGGLRNLRNLDLLQTTTQFTAAPPRLVLDGNQVLYQQAAARDGAEPTERVPIATLSDRTYRALAERPKEARRDVLVGGEAKKEYVRDSRGIPTRRFAYVEKNYWQFMEFVARNKLEGRYQNFFRAANPGTDRPSVRGARQSESKLVRGQKDKKPLTDEQLAVLHQWKGSGLQQRGLSLTSTPRKGEVIGNAGKNFRTTVGIRLTIDLARVPTGADSPIMINHYAHAGVKDAGGPADKAAKDYDYVESVIKNRELFLEFVKPEWITHIEYHDAGSEKEFKLEPGGDADDMMEEARGGTGYDMFAAGFEERLAEKFDKANADADYTSGVAFAEEYNKGYDQGTREDAVAGGAAGAAVDPLAQIGGFDPNVQKDIFAIGRIHGRVRRAKPNNLPGIWT